MSKWHFNIRNLTFCIKWWLQLSKNVMFIISLIWLVVLFSFKLSHNLLSQYQFKVKLRPIHCCHSSSSNSKLMKFNFIHEGLYCKLLYLRVLTSKRVQTVHPIFFKYWNQNNQSPRIDLWSYLTSLLITMFNIVYVAIVNTKSIIDFGH